MNLLSGITGAAQGFFMSGGNPIGAIAGGVAGLAGGGAGGTITNGINGATNTALQTGESAYLAASAQQQLQQLAFQYQQQQQANQFDDATSEKSEIMRESNELRNVSMEQRKADNAITKEFIKSIV